MEAAAAPLSESALMREQRLAAIRSMKASLPARTAALQQMREEVSRFEASVASAIQAAAAAEQSVQVEALARADARIVEEHEAIARIKLRQHEEDALVQDLASFADRLATDLTGVQGVVHEQLERRRQATTELTSASALASWLRMEESMSTSHARLKAALDALESHR